MLNLKFLIPRFRVVSDFYNNYIYVDRENKPLITLPIPNSTCFKIRKNNIHYYYK